MVTNAVCSVLILPGLWLATTHFGAIGAAAANLALNLAYFFVAVRVLHRRLLVSEWRAWFLTDSLVPMLLALGLAAALLALAPQGAARLEQLVFLVLAWLGVALCTAWVMPYSRGFLTRGWATLAERR